ncbi:MAG: hypothetical protein AB7H43_15135 [Acidimicrobiia bacterium]
MSYDFGRFGRHKLRAPNAAIVDLPVPVVADAQVWVATIWPDRHPAAGWTRHLWTLDPTTRRGWQLPHQLAAGDILEFGADTTAGLVRWYGIMDSYDSDRWATIQGPYPEPAAAWDDAQRLLALERFLPALESQPPNTPPPRARTEQVQAPRHRCRR